MELLLTHPFVDTCLIFHLQLPIFFLREEPQYVEVSGLTKLGSACETYDRHLLPKSSPMSQELYTPLSSKAFHGLCAIS